MKKADRLVQRTLFLAGLPNLQRMSQVTIGETVEEVQKADPCVSPEAGAWIETTDTHPAMAICPVVR